MPSTLLYRRIRSGLDIEEAINYRRGKKYSVGSENLTISEISLRFEISIDRLRSRLGYGWTIEQAISGRSKKWIFPYRGGFISLDDFCSRTGIKKSKVNCQRKLGKTLDEIEEESLLKQQKLNEKEMIEKMKVAAEFDFRSALQRIETMAESSEAGERLESLRKLLSLKRTNIHEAAWNLRIPAGVLGDILNGKKDPSGISMRRMKGFAKKCINARKGKRPIRDLNFCA